MKTTWKQAFHSAPGPKNRKESLILFIKGICMGAADIIPGVSGGTIALITGIYENLIQAIQSINGQVIKNLLRLKLKDSLSLIHFKFLVILLSGIIFAILSISRVMHFLLLNYPVTTWSLFLGLILASILVVGKTIKSWFGLGGIGFIIGTVIAWFVVGMIPHSTPETWWFIIFSGMIAICAMILPGLSGAFILLILGKYEYITGTLKTPFQEGHLTIIFLFCLGCLIGITLFSRVLSYFLDRYENLVMAILTGLMLGSIRKLWPWKEVLESKMIRGKTHVISENNVLPQQFDGTFFLACALIVIGFLLVLFMEGMAKPSKK